MSDADARRSGADPPGASSICVSNAVKFTDAGEVFLRVRMTDETERSVEVRVEVVDTGIGVAAAAQEHLFEAFIQA